MLSLIKGNAGRHFSLTADAEISSAVARWRSGVDRQAPLVKA